MVNGRPGVAPQTAKRKEFTRLIAEGLSIAEAVRRAGPRGGHGGPGRPSRPGQHRIRCHFGIPYSSTAGAATAGRCPLGAYAATHGAVVDMLGEEALRDIVSLPPCIRKC